MGRKYGQQEESRYKKQKKTTDITGAASEAVHKHRHSIADERIEIEESIQL